MTDTDVRRIEDKVDQVGLVLAELKGSLQPTLDKLMDRQAIVDEVLKDHENRIRQFERFRYAIPTSAVVSALAAVGALIYVFLPGGHP